MRRRESKQANGSPKAGVSHPHGGGFAWLHSREAICFIAVFLIALLVRALYLLEMRDTPLFSVLMGDAARYDAWARQIADGDWFGREVFYQAPFYPYFLATVYKIFGHDLGIVRLLQIIIGSMSCALLMLAGRRFFSLGIGTLAGVILALYPPAVFFDGLIQKAVFGLFFMALLLLLLGQLKLKMQQRWSLLIGMVLGLLALTRENALILVPIVVLWLVLHFSRE